MGEQLPVTKEAPIYVHTHDMLAWLTGHLEHWPRAQRFILARETMNAATELYEHLLRARKVSAAQRSGVLLEADVALETLKGLVRLGHEKQYMNNGQYAHVSRMLAEIGRELGGWRTAIKNESGR
jgi:hypothetical protein